MHTSRLQRDLKYSRGQHDHGVSAVQQKEALELHVGRQLAGAQVHAQPVQQVCRQGAKGEQGELNRYESGRQAKQQCSTLAAAAAAAALGVKRPEPGGQQEGRGRTL